MFAFGTTEDVMDSTATGYYAVIFTSRKREDGGYEEMSARMNDLASNQPGFLGIESARSADGLGITVSYWRDEGSIAAWKKHLEHREAQRLGRDRWYGEYRIRVCRVEREYSFSRADAETQ